MHASGGELATFLSYSITLRPEGGRGMPTKQTGLLPTLKNPEASDPKQILHLWVRFPHYILGSQKFYQVK